MWLKMGQRTQQTPHQRRYTHRKWAYEKDAQIIGHQGNAGSKHQWELPLYTHLNGQNLELSENFKLKIQCLKFMLTTSIHYCTGKSS